METLPAEQNMERHRKRKRKYKGEIALAPEEKQNVLKIEQTPQKSVKKSRAKKESSSNGTEINVDTKENRVSERVEELSSSGNGVKPSDQEATFAEEKKKRKREFDDGTDIPPPKAKHKKAKKNRDEEISKEINDFSESSKRKKTTGFSDPRKDSELSDQAQKALTYAFIQFHRPKRWKFNKARQNWLIRNIWSTKEIPDIYYPLVMAYLAKVQGGTRENLIKVCKEILKAPDAIDPTTVTAPKPVFSDSVPTSTNTVEDGETKKTRAKAIIDCLDSEGQAGDL